MNRVAWILTIVGLSIAVFGGVTLAVPGPSGENVGLDLKAPEKKLIGIGWEFCGQTPQDMTELMIGMQDGPFDGLAIGLDVISPVTGEHCTYRNICNGAKWERDWFSADLAALKSASSPTLTDNFFRLLINPEGPSGAKGLRAAWADDKRWGAIANNFGIVAWLAKNGGMKGIVLDPEEYNRPGIEQFRCLPEDGDYETAARLARQRGAQVMRALAHEYPDITILAFWLLSFRPELSSSRTPALAVRENNDLWVPFVNGLLDELPPKARLVDACENAYRFQGDDFARQAYHTRNRYIQLVSPENQGKYRSQVQAGFGLYMDAHENPEGSSWYQGPLNGSRAARLRQNAADALEVADEYVWLWGEEGCWRKWKPKSGGSYDNVPLWEDQIPGAARALKLAKEPDGMGRQEVEALRAQGRLNNLAANPEFDLTEKGEGSSTEGMGWQEEGVPAGWRTWQDRESEGTFSRDPAVGHLSLGSARATGVSAGCLIQDHPVKYGEWYAIEAFARPQGRSKWSVTARWYDANGRWVPECLDRTIYPTERDGDWQRAFGVVSVPMGAAQMILLIDVSQQGQQDSCWFDDVGVYKFE